MTENDVAEVREHFGVFNPVPSVALDSNQNTDDESYVLIEGGGLSIGKHHKNIPTVQGPGAYRYLVYNHEGEDDGKTYSRLSDAILAAMQAYAAELFRRTDDRLSTAALAAEFRDGHLRSV